MKNFRALSSIFIINWHFVLWTECFLRPFEFVFSLHCSTKISFCNFWHECAVDANRHKSIHTPIITHLLSNWKQRCSQRILNISPIIQSQCRYCVSACQRRIYYYLLNQVAFVWNDDCSLRVVIFIYSYHHLLRWHWSQAQRRYLLLLAFESVCLSGIDSSSFSISHHLPYFVIEQKRLGKHDSFDRLIRQLLTETIPNIENGYYHRWCIRHIEIIFIISANGVNDKVNLVPVGIINAALIS